MKLSIIIPMYNEAEALPKQLSHWQQLVDAGAELIVVDGGSQDDSVRLVREAGFQAFISPRGRASQMNYGAKIASGSILIFLHSDTVIPGSALIDLEARLKEKAKHWGRFNVAIEGRSKMLPIVACLINLRSRLSGIATGDQAIFIERNTFQQVQGFPDQPLMEDVAICRRLLRISRPLCLKAKVLTSGRRWDERGAWRTIFLMWRLRWAYWQGASPDDLAKAYR